MDFLAAVTSRRTKNISDDTDLMNLLAWGVEQGWSVSMTRNGDIVFDKGDDDGGVRERSHDALDQLFRHRDHVPARHGALLYILGES